MLYLPYGTIIDMQLFFPINPGDELPVSAFFGRKPLLAPEFGVAELLFKHVDAGLESGVLLLGTRVPFVRQVLIVGQGIHLFLQHLYLHIHIQTNYNLYDDIG